MRHHRPADFFKQYAEATDFQSSREHLKVRDVSAYLWVCVSQMPGLAGDLSMENGLWNQIASYAYMILPGGYHIGSGP